jgi:hypothetical protein
MGDRGTVMKTKIAKGQQMSFTQAEYADKNNQRLGCRLLAA